MYSYVNFNFGNNIEQKVVVGDFRKYSLEFVFFEKFCKYENVDFNGIVKSKSVVDVLEYVNFFLGKIFESSNYDSLLVNGDIDVSLDEVFDYVGFLFGKVLDENEWW